MAEISALGDYGEVKIPNMLDVMSKQAQTDKYNLDVAGSAREFYGFKQHGLAAAQGDPEAITNLLGSAPILGKTMLEGVQTGVQTAQAKDNMAKAHGAQIAQFASQFTDPAQREAIVRKGLDLAVQQGFMPQARADYIRGRMDAAPDETVDGLIHANLAAAQTPRVAGQTSIANLPARAAEIGINRSYDDPVTVPVRDPAAPGGWSYPRVPRPSLPGAGTVPGMGLGGTPWSPTITGPTGPPSSGGLPGVTRTPLGGPRSEIPGAMPASYSGGGASPVGGAPGAEATGDELPSAAFVARLHGQESRNQNVRNAMGSSASGAGQFIDRTWIDQAPKITDTTGMSRDQVLALRSDPNLQQAATLNYAKENAAYLSSRGLPVTAATLAMAHKLGPGGAAMALQADPATPMTRILDKIHPNATAQNPVWARQSVAGFVNSHRNSFGDRPVADIAAPPPTGAAPAAPGATAPSAAVAPATRGTGATLAVPPPNPADMPPSTAIAPEPPPTTAPSAPARGAKFGLYVGDSITAQQIRHGGQGSEDRVNRGQPIQLGTTAGIGDGPRRVVERIDALDRVPETVFLSSGVTNRPDEIDATSEAVEKLRAKGAAYVVVPGVGPGVPNSAKVNEQLKEAVESRGGIFFEPQVKWVTNKNESGIHPAEVDKVNEQAMQALQRAQSRRIIPNSERSELTPDATSGEGPTTVSGAGISSSAADLAAGGDTATADTVLPRGSGPTAVATPIPGVTEAPAATLAQSRTPLPPGWMEGPNPIEQGILKETHEFITKEYREKVGKDAEAAAQGMVALRKLDTILNTGELATGTLATQKAAISDAISSFANTIGKTSSYTDRRNALNDMFNSISKQLAFDMVTALGSREAQQIVAQVMDIKPSLLHSVAGNKAIIEPLRQVFQMQIDKKAFYGKWLSDPKNYGKEGVSEAFFKENPVDVYASRAIPLQIPKNSDGKILKDESVPNAYYDVGDDKRHFPTHETGDRALFDGKGFREAGKPSYLMPSGKR